MPALFLDASGLDAVQARWRAAAAQLATGGLPQGRQLGPLTDLFGELADHERRLTQRMVETLGRGSDDLAQLVGGAQRVDRSA